MDLYFVDQRECHAQPYGNKDPFDAHFGEYKCQGVNPYLYNYILKAKVVIDCSSTDIKCDFNCHYYACQLYIGERVICTVQLTATTRGGCTSMRQKSFVDTKYHRATVHLIVKYV